MLILMTILVMSVFRSLRHISVQEAPEASNGAVSAKSSDDRLPHQRWQGKSTRFMRSNEHSRERSGVWNTDGLEGTALSIVKGDKVSAR